MFKIIIKRKDLIGKKRDIEDLTICEAISTVYNYSEDLFIFICWNGFKIPMDGISFSQIYNDVIIMLEELEHDDDFYVSFLDASFTAIWNFSINIDRVIVEAKWINIAPYHYKNTTIEDLRKVSNIINVNKKEFINEWNNLLKIIKYDLLSVGYTNELEGFDYLNNLD